MAALREAVTFRTPPAKTTSQGRKQGHEDLISFQRCHWQNPRIARGHVRHNLVQHTSWAPQAEWRRMERDSGGTSEANGTWHLLYLYGNEMCPWREGCPVKKTKLVTKLFTNLGMRTKFHQLFIGYLVCPQERGDLKESDLKEEAE